MVTFKEWLFSDYTHDLVKPKKRDASWEITSRKISLLDIPSQLIKFATELLLLPATIGIAMTVSVINIPLKIFQEGSLNPWKYLFKPLINCIIIPPASILNRIYLLGVNFFGIASPNFAASFRQDAYDKFPSTLGVANRFFGLKIKSPTELREEENYPKK